MLEEKRFPWWKFSCVSGFGFVKKNAHIGKYSSKKGAVNWQLNLNAFKVVWNNGSL